MTDRQTYTIAVSISRVSTLTRTLTRDKLQGNGPLYKYCDWYTDRWWVGCYIWYSEDGSVGRVPDPSSLYQMPTHQRPVYQLHIIRCDVIAAYYSMTEAGSKPTVLELLLNGRSMFTNHETNVYLVFLWFAVFDWARFNVYDARFEWPATGQMHNAAVIKRALT